MPTAASVAVKYSTAHAARSVGTECYAGPRRRVELVPMRRTLLLTTLVMAAINLATGTAEATRTVKAQAKFTVQLGEQSGSYDFGQSPINKSRLDWTPQVPVSLHASPKSDPFKEFVLSGRVKKGKQRTSDAVALGLNLDVGTQSMLMNSTDGGCTVRVKTLTEKRIAGSFKCDTAYGGESLKADGTFKAR